jgi:methionine synthase II (cobalamin-independent)
LTEFKVWSDVKLPAGKILTPGVVSYATDLVEHPELVADRIITFAEIVGQENVIAGADCGLGEIASGDRRGQAARRRGDREQEVVELNSCRMDENERVK